MSRNPYTRRNNPKLYKQWNNDYGICYDYCQPRRYRRCERRSNYCGYNYGCYKPTKTIYCAPRQTRSCYGYYS